VSTRNSPLILTNADNRFYEVYVGETSRSYEDAFFAGEPIFSRDLLTGRRKLLLQESRVTEWEKAYLTANPNARLLDPEEDGSDDVSVAATAEADILAVIGPYVLYDQRLTLERNNFEQSDSARGALDLRSGKKVAIEDVASDSTILSSGAVREDGLIRWRHSGYDVVARWNDDREESQMSLRDMRGHEWPLGYISSRVPRIFWLDEPRVDGRLRSALAGAFEEARDDDVDAQLVRRKSMHQSRHVMLTALHG
jgi:hypothetical protein